MANEGRILIYFDDLIMALTRTYGETMDAHIYSPRDILSSIQGLRPVDAVPVVHGYWHIDDCDSGEPDGYAAFIEAHCSRCGYELGAESGQYGWVYGDPFPLNYCPNCGADMRERSEGE